MSGLDDLCTVVGGESSANQVLSVELTAGEVFITTKRFTTGGGGSCVEECVCFEVSAIRDVMRELRRIQRFWDDMALDRVLRDEVVPT